jgi:hypothetical protein
LHILIHANSKVEEFIISILLSNMETEVQRDGVIAQAHMARILCAGIEHSAHAPKPSATCLLVEKGSV